MPKNADGRYEFCVREVIPVNPYNGHACCYTVRGGPVLHMATASMRPMTEWGRKSLLPLATSKVDADAFCTSNCDDETVEKVSQPMSNVGRELSQYSQTLVCAIVLTTRWVNVLLKGTLRALDPTKWIEFIIKESPGVMCA